MEVIEQERPDLALLDLQMPEVDGLGVVRLVRKSRMPLVAFVTAYDEYAVKAFEMNAVDYLLKPIDGRGWQTLCSVPKIGWSKPICVEKTSPTSRTLQQPTKPAAVKCIWSASPSGRPPRFPTRQVFAPAKAVKDVGL
ncbi:MAG: response regulator [Acidobacteria bacterium]|nr:response regulator [Acidobacteriota bacterium]MCI0721322.1 response regulator [Acidobacteriota bacterium]